MKNRRKTRVTDRSYQGRIVLTILAICGFYVLVNVLLFNVLSHNKLEEVKWQMHLNETTTGEILGSVLVTSTLITLALTVGTLVLFVWRLFRRTAGPINRFRSFFEHAENGDLAMTISLREGDDFRETADACNTMLSSVRKSLMLIRDGTARMEEEMTSMERFIDQPESVREQCKRQIAELDAMRRELSPRRGPRTG